MPVENIPVALVGQDSDDARQVVRAQRDLKKNRDALRKLEKKLALMTPDDPARAEDEEKVHHLRAEIEQLEKVAVPNVIARERRTTTAAVESAPLDPKSPNPVRRDPEAVAATAQVTITQEAKSILSAGRDKNCSPYIGQDTDEAKAAARLQRDFKKKEAAQRKLEKQLKSLAAADPSRADIELQLLAIKEEVTALQASLADAGKGPSAVDVVAGTTPAAAAVAVQVSKPDVDELNATKVPTVPLAPPQSIVPTTSVPLQSVGEQLKSLLPGNANVQQMSSIGLRSKVELRQVHYRVAELGLMMQSMIIVGGNARTFAMIGAFRQLLMSTPALSQTSFRDVKPKDLEGLIETNYRFLCRSREPSPGMRYVKQALMRRVFALSSAGDKAFQLDENMGTPLNALIKSAQKDGRTWGRSSDGSVLEGNPREIVVATLDSIEKELLYSLRSIVDERSLPYVSPTDTILVFGRSSAVEMILLRVAKDERLKTKPRVIVVDASPLYEGRELANKLARSGLQIAYGLLTSCCTLLPQCTKVFIGASAVLQNGDVFGRCGTALVVASAKQFRKPVLCFCESYKFVSEVWLGNLVQNSQLAEVQRQQERQPAADSGSGCPSMVGRLGGMGSPAVSTPPMHVPPGGTHLFAWPQHGGRGVSPLASAGSMSPGLVRPGWSTSNAAMQAGSSNGAIASASGYLYDLTPAAYIDMIVCEMGCLHTSAIVAAIRDREDREAMLAAEG